MSTRTDGRKEEAMQFEPVEPARVHVPARTWMMLAILFLLSILSFVDRGIVALLVDPLKRAFAIDDLAIGLLQGPAFVVTYAALTIPMGWVADRYSRRGVIFFGVVAWSLATAACGLAASFGALIVARLCVGVGEACLSPAAISLVVERFPKRRLGLALGILHTGTSMGSAAAFAIGGLLIAWAEGLGPGAVPAGVEAWQLVFLAIGLPGLLLALLVFLIPPSVPGGRAALVSAPGFGWWIRRVAPYIGLMASGMGLVAAVQFAMLSWLPALLARRYGADPAMIGGALGFLFAIFASCGFIGGGWVVDALLARGVARPYFRYLTFCAGGVALVGGLGFALSGSMTATLCVTGVVLLMTPINGPLFALLQMQTPAEYRSRMVAIVNVVALGLAMGLGPTSVAFLTEHLFGADADINYSIAVVAALFGCVALALFVTAGRLRRDPAGVNPSAGA